MHALLLDMNTPPFSVTDLRSHSSLGIPTYLPTYYRSITYTTNAPTFAFTPKTQLTTHQPSPNPQQQRQCPPKPQPPLLTLLLTSLILLTNHATAMSDGTCPDENDESPVLLPDTENWSVFYECVSGIPVANECMGGLLLNPYIDECDLLDRVPRSGEGGYEDWDAEGLGRSSHLLRG